MCLYIYQSSPRRRKRKATRGKQQAIVWRGILALAVFLMLLGVADIPLALSLHLPGAPDIYGRTYSESVFADSLVSCYGLVWRTDA